MIKFISLIVLTTLLIPLSFAKDLKLGEYYVKDDVTEVRLSPNQNGTLVNKLYRREKVNLLEVSGKWGRVSDYYYGNDENEDIQVARWIQVKSLSSTRPDDLAQSTIKSDPRILKGAIPKVGEDGLKESDIKILYKAATKYLNSGKCSIVQFANKSIDRPKTYYINCGAENIFFTPSDL